MKSKKIKNFIIFIILTIIFIIGFLIFGKNSEKNIENHKNSQFGEIRKTFLDIFADEEKKLQEENKAFNEATKYKNPNSCKIIKTENKKQECEDTVVMLIAIEKNDFEICKNIQTENINQDCNHQIIEKNAIDKKNKILCNAIQDEKQKIACRETIDAQNLKKILQEWEITAKKCEELENNFKSECLKQIDIYKIEENYQKAINSENISLCQDIEDKNLKKNCQEKILIEKAIKEKNIFLCEYGSNEETKNNCRKKIIKNNDSQNLEIAIKTNNLQQCKNLSDEILQNSCNDIIIFDFVKKTKNISLCKSLKNKENIPICEILKD